MDTSAIVGLVGGLGSLVLIGVGALLVGDRWARRASTGYGDFFPTLHLIAFVAALVGLVLAGMAFVSDHPRKWLHLILPMLFVGIVYGYALGLNKEAWGYLIKDVSARLSRKNAA